MTLPKYLPVTLGILGLALLAALGYGGYRYYTLSQAYAIARFNLASTSVALGAEQEAAIALQTKNTQLSSSLMEEQQRNGGFSSVIDNLSSTVGTLSKLADTDPQLLAKYSKIYFLNENYVPAKLSDIPTNETYDQKREYQFESDALPFLQALISDATDAGVGLEVVSSYRSFGDQSSLKTGYKVTYGAGTANSFSADQGYSEHQLGTAVDFTTTILGAGFSNFANSPAYPWLVANAYKYGFILSYPKGNKYYTYEPWHWRFVGVGLATYLHEQNMNFYDLDQRTINTYLISIFNPA